MGVTIFTPTPEQLQWLIAHFPNTKNDEIIQHLGISNTRLHRLARQYGLTKTKEFMSKCQAEATHAAWVENKLRGYPPKGYQIPNRGEGFKKGETPLMRLGPERNAERIAKATATRNETIRKDKMRIRWGFEQKTKMKLFSSGRNRVIYRHLLKKKGYIIERDGTDAIVTSETRRSPRMEATCDKIRNTHHHRQRQWKQSSTTIKTATSSRPLARS